MAIKNLQAYYQSIVNNRIQQYNDAVKKYYEDLQKLQLEKVTAPSFFDYVGGAFTIGAQGFKGYKNAWINFGSFSNNVIVGFFNDLYETGKAAFEGDYEEAGRDFLRSIINPVLMFAESLVGGATGILATGSELIGAVPELFGARNTEWQQFFGQGADFFQDVGLFTNALANATRAYIEGETKAFDALYSDKQAELNKIAIEKEYEDTPLFFMDNAKMRTVATSQQGILNQPIGDRFTYADFLRSNATATLGITEITDGWFDSIINGFGLFDTTERAQEAFGGTRVFETLKGVADSVGAIFAMRTVANMASKANLTPKQVATASQAFFFGNIAGQSINEALENGADIQDAISYGLAVAASETAIENLMGIKFGAINQSIARKGWSFIKNGFEEGIEEVIAEFVRPGYEQILTGERAEISPKETIINSITAFLSGFAASSFVGAGQAIVLDNTVQSKNEKIIKKFDKYVEKYGPEVALEKMKLEIVNFVKFVNDPGARGQVFNEKGAAYVTRLNEKQKDNIINNSIVKFLVEKQENGTYLINREAFNKLTEESFRNKDAQGQVINNAQYAINDNVFGVDITDGDNYDVKKVENLNAQERIVYEVSKRLGVPVAIFEGTEKKALVVGEYGSNGVFYINSKNITEENARTVSIAIAKHEAIHALKVQSPELYEQLRLSVADLVTIEYNKDTGLPQVVFANEEIKQSLPNLEADIQSSFASYVTDQVKPERIVQLMNEEIVAYFVEETITDAALVNVIGKKDKKLLDRISEFFGIEEAVETNLPYTSVKQINRYIDDYAKTWRSAMKVYQKQQQSLVNFVAKTFGDEARAMLFFSAEAVRKYGANNLIYALPTYEQSTNTIQINGERINIDSVRNPDYDFNDARPQKTKTLTDEELNVIFRYDPANSAEYFTQLRRYEVFIDSGIDYIPRNSVEFRQARERLNLIEKLVDQYKDNRIIKPAESEMYILAEAWYSSKSAEQEKRKEQVKEKERNPEPAIVNTSITRFVNVFKESTAFDFKNRFTTYGAAVYQQEFNNKEEALDTEKVIEILIENYTTGKGKNLLRNRYQVELQYDGKTKVGTFLVTPTRAYVQEQIAKKIEKFEAIQEPVKAEEIAELDANNFPLTRQQAEYFKDSKARNEKGQLIPLYHGSLKTDITRFSVEYYGTKTGVPDKYIFFTNDFQTADNFSKEYTQTNSKFFQIPTGKKGKVYTVYLDMQNPLDLRNLTEEQIKFIARSAVKNRGEEYNFALQQVRKYAEKQDHQMLKIFIEGFDVLNAEYDGIIAEMYPGTGIFEYGVFFAEQIKAIENQTPEETDNIYDDIRPQKTKTRQLTEEEKAKILELFPSDKFIDTYFEVNAAGNYVVKESLIRSSTIRRNYATLKQKDANGNTVNKIYKSNEYAVNVDLGYDYAIDLTDSRYKDIDIVRLEDILNNPQTAAIYHIFKNLGIRFIGYETKGDKTKLNKYLGFSINRTQNDAVFINFKYFVTDPASVYETIFHELTHEIFKTNRQALIELAKLYRNVFFDRKPGTFDYRYSPDFNAFDRHFKDKNGTAFLSYLRSSYPSMKPYLRKANDLYYLLDNIIEGKIDINDDSLDSVTTINEFLAQITGMLIASDTLINQVFKVDEFQKLRLFNFYEQIINNGSKTRDTLNAMQNVGSAFHQAYLAHQKTMQERFPTQKIKFTTKEANAFIKTFTDGKFNTKAQLVKGYQLELQSGKKGDATFVFNSIISLASKYGRTVQDAVESMDNVKQYFQQQLDAIQMLIDNPQDAAYLSVTKMPKQFAALERLLNKTLKQFNTLIEENNNGLPVKNPFDNADFLISFADKFNDFVIQYSAVNPEILDIFDLQESSVIESLGNDIQNALLGFIISTEAYNNIPNKDQSAIGQRLIDTVLFLGNFKNLIDGLQAIKNLKDPNYSLLMNIAKLQADIFDLDTNKLYLILKNAVQRTYNAINTGNQAKSKMNNDLIDAFNAINLLLENLKRPITNMAVFETQVLETIKKLDTIITTSDRILDLYAVYGDDGNIDRPQTVNDIREKFLFDLYGFYGAIFNKQDALYNKDLGDFANAVNQTVDSLDYKKNYYQFGKAFSKLFFALQTEYLSVFGEIPYQELVEKESQIALNIKDQFKQGVPQLKSLKDGGVYSALEVRLPQHILQTYDKFFSSNGSTLFKQFFDLYVDMTYRRSTIRATYDKQRKAFLESHPDIEKFEFETIEVPGQLTYGLNQFDLDKIVSEVRTLREERKKKLQENNTQIKDIKKSMQEDTKRLAVLLELRRKTRKNTSDYYNLTRQIDDIKGFISRGRKAIQAFTRANDAIKNTTITFQQELQVKLVEFAEKEKLEIPKMTRGELIKLYMDIKREHEMHNQVDTTDPYQARIKATNHYDVGGSFQIFDSVLALEKSYEAAKAKADEKFYIIVKTREEMLDILEDFMKDDANYSILIDEAKRVYKQNYDYVDEIYSARFQTSLPREEFYSPFRTNNSDWLRNFELKRKNKNNIGVADGFTLETTIGARTPLVIQNVSSVMSGTTTAAANYSYERLITDFQSLLVTKASGSNFTYAQLLAGIDGDSFLKFFEKTFTDVLGYGSERLALAERLFSQVQNLSISASMALSLSVYIKQFISIYKVGRGNKLNFIEFALNILKHGVPFVNTELRQWLLENNSNMYERSEFGGVPNIATTATADTFTSYRRGVRKLSRNIQQLFGKFNNHADSTVLVAGFATLVNKVKKENPDLTTEEVLEKANEIFSRTTLLFDVANTDTAFRTRFSSGKNFVQRYVSKYMSENMIHISNITTKISEYRMGLGGKDQIFEAIIQFLVSSILSALVGSSFSRLNGYVQDDEIVSDFLVNELLLQNLLGAIPYINLVTSLFQVVNGKFQQQYDVRLPLVSDTALLVTNLFRLGETIIDVANGDAPSSKIFREIIRTIEGTANFTGIPFANFRKMVGYVLKLETEWFGGESYYAFEEFWFSRTNAQQFGAAVKAQDEQKITNYIGRTLENVAVKEEIINVLLDNEDASLSLRFNLDSFQAKDPVTEEMVSYSIPEKTREKYKIFAQKALSYLIKTSKYKKMDEKDKLAAIQRVFNYYYNFMKNEILVEAYKSLPAKVKMEIDYDAMRRKKLLDIQDVINNALKDY